MLFYMRGSAYYALFAFDTVYMMLGCSYSRSTQSDSDIKVPLEKGQMKFSTRDDPPQVYNLHH